MPHWVQDATKSAVKSLSIDDSELPALEIDPTAMSPISSRRDARTRSKWEVDNTEDIICTQNRGDDAATQIFNSQTRSSKLHHQERIKWSCHVFDPVLGVIPRETRDLWVQGAKTSFSGGDSQNRNDFNKEASSCKISTSSAKNYTLLADEVAAENSIVIEGGSRKRRSLPPVRFS